MIGSRKRDIAAGQTGAKVRRSVCIRKHGPAVTLALAVAIGAACNERPAIEGSTPDANATATQARDVWVRGIDSLAVALVELDSAISRTDGSATRINSAEQAFHRARRAFKRVEFAVSYYEPSTATKLNGPVLPDVEDAEGPEVVYPPEGLQVIEEWLFNGADTTRRATALEELHNAETLVRNLRRASAAQVVTDNRVWEAARLEIARISTLGIAGFDSPIAQASLLESAAALQGVRDALQSYRVAVTKKDASAWQRMDSAFSGAIATLNRSTSFGEFNRLQFIVAHATPLAREVFAVQNLLGLKPPEDRRAFRAAAASIFDSAAFDAHAFANPLSAPDSPAQVELGRELFFDNRLAGDSKQSCASCHDPSRAFTDGRARSVSRVAAHDAVMRNTPTVINAGLQNGLFADQRTMFLEDQVEAVLTSRNEMHSSAASAAERLSHDPVYVNAFRAAFESKGDSVVTAERVRKSVAAYVRSLTALNSRVDVAMRGDTLALNAAERRGFNLFTGKAKCASCHFLPLFNGSVPPTYRSSDVEVLGVPARVATSHGRIDPDSGRFAITRSAPHLFAFKTPGVRNVALTAPYMHNGAYRTLEEVVDFYARGGGVGIGIALGNQTLPFDSLELSKTEQRDVVAFLRALTDTVGTTKQVLRRPSSSPLPLRAATLPE